MTFQDWFQWSFCQYPATWQQHTQYPMIYAQMLCCSCAALLLVCGYVITLLTFQGLCGTFTHVLQGLLHTCSGAIVWMLPWQWNKPVRHWQNRSCNKIQWSWHHLCNFYGVQYISSWAPISPPPTTFKNAQVVMHFISPCQIPVMSQMIVLTPICLILNASGMKRPLKLTSTFLICQNQLRKCSIPTCH